jgi:hypothetical protein
MHSIALFLISQQPSQSNEAHPPGIQRMPTATTSSATHCLRSRDGGAAAPSPLSCARCSSCRGRETTRKQISVLLIHPNSSNTDSSRNSASSYTMENASSLSSRFCSDGAAGSCSAPLPSVGALRCRKNASMTKETWAKNAVRLG